jgi:hypothetical protein
MEVFRQNRDELDREGRSCSAIRNAIRKASSK